MQQATDADRGGQDPTLTALTSAARETWRANSRADAQRLRACYALFRECERRDRSGIDDDVRPGYAVVDPLDVCCAHLVAQFAISHTRAETMAKLAIDLTVRYPAVLSALTDGLLDQRAAELLAHQMRTVDDAVLAHVQQEAVDAYLAALAAGEHLGRSAVRDMIDDIIRRHDADGIRARREDASRMRGVNISKGTDGMSTLWATLASDEAAILAEALDQRANEFADPDSPWNTTNTTTDGNTASDAAGNGDNPADMSHYSLPERRADALMSLILGEQPAPTHPDADADAGDGNVATAPGATAPGATPVRPKVTVIAATRDDDEPAVQFPRSGDSTIQALLAMLATSTGATLDRVDPTLGAADQPGRALDYRPGAALARTIRLRDGTCRHPGCTVAAEYCDLDHLIPFDHTDPGRGGPTREDNLLCLCRRHHRFKTFAGWHYRMDPDGTLTITTDDAHLMLTRPAGPLAAYRRAQARDEQTKWDTQQQHTPATTPDAGPPTEPTYWHRRAARVRAERRTTRHRREYRARHYLHIRRPSLGIELIPHQKPRPTTTPNPDSHIEQQLVELLDPPPF